MDESGHGAEAHEAREAQQNHRHRAHGAGTNNTSPAQTTRPANMQRPATTGVTTQPSTERPKVQQPKPQALPSRSGPSSILVSPRQKGNPILNTVRNVAWEYSDIPADYVLGATTCALFLSLKYHRLHPEYIYNRIRDLRGQYDLRILLTMVDIENHEEALRELSKTSLINGVTIILCWSAQEAGRYLELYKTFENTAPTSIRAQQSSSHSDKLVEFITVPRSINKTDALELITNFGSVRAAVNAQPEEVGMIAGWGEKKVQRWCNSVREPFRVKKAARRTVNQGASQGNISTAEGESVLSSRGTTSNAPVRLGTGDSVPLAPRAPGPLSPEDNPADADRRPPERIAETIAGSALDAEEAALRKAKPENTRETAAGPLENSSAKGKRKAEEDDMSEGIMAALNKLRQQ